MARNNGYSASELMAMQRDAAERVREMQQRARQRMEQGNMPPSPPSPPPPPGFASHQGPPPLSHPQPPQAQPLGFLQNLLQDNDRLLLLMLILVLSQEKADPGLLMALAWLMF